MDEEENRNTSGLMGGFSDYRPGFYGGGGSEEEREEREEGGGSATRQGGAQAALKKGEQAAAKKGVETVANATTGGAAGTAMKVASRAEQIKGGAQDSLAKGKLKGAGGAAKGASASIAIVGLVILGYGLMSFIGQWLFPIGFKARLTEDWNSTKTSTTARTDALTDAQLAGDTEEPSIISDLVFEEMGFSEAQIQSFKDAGLEYETLEDGTVVLEMERDGVKTVITSNKAVSGTKDGVIAESGETVSDSGTEADEATIAERKSEILAELGIADNGTNVVKTFREALSDWNFKERYMIATRAWRGDVSGWFNEMTETVVQRLGISRNNYSDFELTGDNEKDTENFLELAKTKAAAEEGSDIGDKSLMERVTEVAEGSAGVSCGVSSAFNDVESVISADQTARQVSAGSLFLEAIDKTKAGEGNSAPLSAINNIIINSGGASAEGVSYLFGSGVLNQASELVQNVSAQAHGNDEAITSGADDVLKYRGCIYEGNVNTYNSDGVIARIGSVFERAGGWVGSVLSNASNLIKKLIGGGTIVDDGSDPTTAQNALSSTVEAYEKMKDQSYFNGEDTAVLGEAMVTAAERIYNEKAKSAGQVIGDEDTLIANYRAQQEIIAEEAEFERQTKSPFDMTSEYTFLGSIAYSLIPLATSSESVSITSTLANVGSVLSNAVSSLLPTSQAISEIQVSRGDCVLSNNIGAVSNAHCNNYYNSELSLTNLSPTKLFDMVANLRYDEGGYIFGTSKSDAGEDSKKNKSGPLNEEENNLPSHWGRKGPAVSGTGEPHGCESDWESTTVGGVTLYYYDQPIEWKYSRYTNFEHEGYNNGWPADEDAKNDEDPGQCVLDMKVENGQPVVNINSALGLFLLMSGQRSSEWGVADDTNLDLVAKTDFTKGRIHPCVVGSDECGDSTYVDLSWSDDEENSTISGFLAGFAKKTMSALSNKLSAMISGKTSNSSSSDDNENSSSTTTSASASAKSNAAASASDGLKTITAASPCMSRWIGGSAYVAYDGSGMDSFGSMVTGFQDDERFKDCTRDNDYFWNEMKYYQAYGELLEWMEAANLVNTSSATVAVNSYYEENPLDNSYTGVIARYSGMSKERVVAVLDLVEYVAFLNEYDAAALYPVPAPKVEKIKYSNDEVIAEAEKATQNNAIIYEELRNRTVAV